MDSKGYFSRALRQLCCIVGLLMLTACTWVKDDVDDCPEGFWLNLHYTYNILDVEAVQEYVNEVAVYIYDTEGNYVSRIDVPSATLAAHGHRVRVEGLPEGDYRFVVWSGTANSQYAVSGDRGAMEAFRLSLSNTGETVSSQLPDLYYGYLENVHFSDAYASHDVYMMKDNNHLACLVVTTSDDTAVELDDFNMKITSANGVMDVMNQPVGDRTVVYEPFERSNVTVNDAEYGQLNGVAFNIMTLRMMEDLDCRLILQKKDTGEKVFDISFPEYVGMIGTYYTNLGRPLTVQEYLDRQDFYTIVFFLSEDFSQLVRLEVNSWRLRAKNHLKL